MSWMQTKTRTLILSAWLVSVGAASAAPGAAVEATTTVNGTAITVTPSESYTTGTLTIVGPDGYEAHGRFHGGAMSLDLAIARRLPQPDPAGSSRLFDPMAAGAIPEGEYRYEARFIRANGGESVTFGRFVVTSGAIGPRERADIASSTGRPLAVSALRSPSVGAFGGGTQNLSADDNVFIVDDANDKLTALQLSLGNSIDGYDFRFWEVINDDGLFRVDFDTNFIPPGSNKLSIDSDGDIGISTAAAAKRLTIHTTTINDGIRLINDNISPGFETTWDFSVDAFAGLTIRDVETGNGVFRLREGAPSESLVVTAAGDLGVGTASPSAKLHVMGSGRIDGDVALGSSRTLKTGFDRIDTAELLSRVADLPVASWRYKSEDETTRHIGPFAEDFQRLFGLGDGETISVIDAQGVTLAAIQALNAKLAAKETEIAELRRQNATLEQRLAAIEMRLDGTK